MFLEWLFHVVFCNLLLVIYMLSVVDQLPRLWWGLVCLLLFACRCVVSVGVRRAPLPLGAWGGLRYFIVALPEPSM